MTFVDNLGGATATVGETAGGFYFQGGPFGANFFGWAPASGIPEISASFFRMGAADLTGAGGSNTTAIIFLPPSTFAFAGTNGSYDLLGDTNLPFAKSFNSTNDYCIPIPQSDGSTNWALVLTNTPLATLSTNGATNGEVIAFNGTNWIPAPGGSGGGGSVVSVTASSPLSSSGGTSPNIQINSYTGSGMVVESNMPNILSPTILGSILGLPVANSQNFTNVQSTNITGIIPAANMPSHSGDVSSPAGSTVNTLSAIGTAGTYTKTTFDSKGRETSGTTLSIGDLPSGYNNGGLAALSTNGTTVTVSGNFILTISQNANGTTNFAIAFQSTLTNNQVVYSIQSGATVRTNLANGSNSITDTNQDLTTTGYISAGQPPTYGTTNSGPSFTPGSTTPKVWIPFTNGSTVYYMPGY
jgi:hypothetical protein